MDLQNLVSKISTLLSDGCSITLHSDQTQGLVGSSNTILWNDEPTHINEEMYAEFKEKLRSHNSRFYTMTNILPYADFCIALLCSSSYSLNHETAACVPPRVFTAAWRSINVTSGINTGEMASWLKRHAKGRTGKGYANTFGLDMDAGTIPLRTPILSSSSRRFNLKDKVEETVIQASMSKDIVDIKHYGDDNLSTPKVWYSTSMPEGQLSDLKIAHEMFRKKF